MHKKFYSRHCFLKIKLFVCVEVLRPSQPNGVMSSAVSLPNHTFTGQALSSKRLTSIVHILSPETDNCPSWISGRERMTVENISWSISTKECCRPRRGSNPRPPGQIFSLFLIVKMNANYVEICWVGNLEVDFQQAPFAHFFLKFSQYCCETLIIWNSEKKSKKIFMQTKIPKNHFTIEIAYIRPIFGRKSNFRVNIGNKTQNQKRQMVSDKIWSMRTKYFHLK